MMQARPRARAPKRKFDKEAERVKAFTPPDWVGKPPPGLHLDIHKSEKLIEKKMIDEKPYYLFGRNVDVVDIPIDHGSASRYHAALVYHKILKRSFIIDLKSTHGSFIGHIRLEASTPKQLQIDQTVHFGASTRTYTLRERPQGTQVYSIQGENKQLQELLGIENEKELDDLTEFNTAHNKRVVIATATEKTEGGKRRQSESTRISFNESAETINPEDIDPSIGRFRNMISSSIVIPAAELAMPVPPTLYNANVGYSNVNKLDKDSSRYNSAPPLISPSKVKPAGSSYLPVVNSAPEPLDLEAPPKPVMPEPFRRTEADDSEPKRKKYAKESWPGRKQAGLATAPLL